MTVTLRLITSLALTACVSHAIAEQKADVKPNYQFEELKSVRSIRASDVKGWGRINDQALIVSSSPSRKYILVLARVDRDLSFSHALGVTSRAGTVQAKFDEVYAGSSSIRVGNRITMIYEVKGDDAMKHARALFELRECESKKDVDCSSLEKAVEDTTVPAALNSTAQ